MVLAEVICLWPQAFSVLVEAAFLSAQLLLVVSIVQREPCQQLQVRAQIRLYRYKLALVALDWLN